MRMTTDGKGNLWGSGEGQFCLDTVQVAARKVDKGWWAVFVPRFVDQLTTESFDRIVRPKPCE